MEQRWVLIFVRIKQNSNLLGFNLRILILNFMNDCLYFGINLGIPISCMFMYMGMVRFINIGHFFLIFYYALIKFIRNWTLNFDLFPFFIFLIAMKAALTMLLLYLMGINGVKAIDTLNFRICLIDFRFIDLNK